MSLEGRVALVTGGGRGIGAAISRALARSGCRVAVAARTLEAVRDVASGIEREGGEASGFSCDATEPSEVDLLVTRVEEVFGPIDILVNNAGAASASKLGSTTPEEWDRIMDVNAKSTFLCTRAVFDGMVARRWGRVVNVASVAGLEGKRYITAYTAAKHAVVGFTRAAAAEAEGTGVDVSAVCPGYVDTPMTDGTIAKVVTRTGRSAEDALRAILDQAGQSRLVTAEEVADAVVALCGEGPGARNGALMILDGNDAREGEESE